MVDGDTVFSHHLLQVAQAQGISQIPADALSNDIDGIMQAFKRFLDQRHGQATLQKNSMLPDHILMRQNPRVEDRNIKRNYFPVHTISHILVMRTLFELLRRRQEYRPASWHPDMYFLSPTGNLRTWGLLHERK